jgi:hypothetical protein
MEIRAQYSRDRNVGPLATYLIKQEEKNPTGPID